MLQRVPSHYVREPDPVTLSELGTHVLHFSCSVCAPQMTNSEARGLNKEHRSNLQRPKSKTHTTYPTAMALLLASSPRSRPRL